VVNATPWLLYSGKETLPLPEFEPRTVQPVVICCTASHSSFGPSVMFPVPLVWNLQSLSPHPAHITSRHPCHIYFIAAGVSPNCWCPLIRLFGITSQKIVNSIIVSTFFIETCAYTFQGWNITHTVQHTLGMLLLSHYNTLFCCFVRQEKHSLFTD
jgi:hypothetical protein